MVGGGDGHTSRRGARGSGSGSPCASGLGATGVAAQLHDQAQLTPTERRLDRTNGSDVATDLHPLTDVDRLLAAEVAGRDDLVSATEFVAILDRRHRRPHATPLT